jgi:hypothetical protein
MDKLSIENEGKTDKEASHVLLVLDDVCSDTDFHHSKTFKQIFTKGRHFKITLIITAQYPYHIPPIARVNCDWFLCGQINTQGLEILCTEFIAGNITKQDFIKMFVKILVTKYDLFVFGGAVMSEISGLSTNDIDISGLRPDFNTFIKDMEKFFVEDFYKFSEKSGSFDSSKVNTYVLHLNGIEIEFDFVDFLLFEKVDAVYKQELLVKTRCDIIHRLDLQKNGNKICVAEYLHHTMIDDAITDLQLKHLTYSEIINTTPKFGIMHNILIGSSLKF